MLSLLARGSRFLSCAPDLDASRPAASRAALPAAPPAQAPAPAVVDPPAMACLRMGRDALGRDDVAGALRAFDAAIAIEPGLGMAHLCRAICLARLDRDEESAAALGVALQEGPAFVAPRLHFARMCARDGDLALSLKILGPALVADPSKAAGLSEDPAFGGLRDHPRFLQMVGAL